MPSRNNIRFLICTLVPIAFAISCKKDFLDTKALSILNEKAIFSDSASSSGFVNSRYGNITFSWEPNRFAGPAGLESATDEAESALSPTAQQTLISGGAANPSNTDKGIWATTYAQIRAINIFLKNKPIIPVSSSKKNRWEGEVRFLRAWYLATMLKHYGGVPLIGNTIFSESDAINIPRNTYEQCVDYVVAECDSAANLLPLVYDNTGGNEYGRITKGAAMSLKARVLLYAASPLTNGPRGDDPDHLVSYPTFDNNRWKKAADAAQAVIDLNQYALYRSGAASLWFPNLFLVYQSTDPKPEQIFSYQAPTTTPNNMYRETIANSPSRGTRYTGTISCFPLQEMVDAFGMKNGLPITDPASGYAGIGDNMYLNRDPRFYSTISFNGSLRALSGYTGDQPVRTYTGVIPSGAGVTSNASSAGLDGIYKINATKTGYYCYKMLSNTVINGGSELNRPRILIRYAEILLDAAEASNEFNGPNASVYTWLKDIRSRAGIDAGTNGSYGIKDNMTKEEMRTFIQAERRMELAYEEHRFWDVRRWKIAPVTENKDMHGMEITRAADGTFSYKPIVVRTHVFRDNMYFWPIPQSEITKAPATKQNPGY